LNFTFSPRNGRQFIRRRLFLAGYHLNPFQAHEDLICGAPHLFYASFSSSIFPIVNNTKVQLDL
jgi:hypothetical protein